ncbi:PAS domain S-box protein [Roseomonas sp. 18066]|uniref:PAS domain S-box protein n=1 Tax=Roseomonas sp. 18066 TaxID=2681412 RepID=UPI00190F1E72|nr:PAS domain S-box protein [Roseomonas sp. 18066]
MSGDGARLWTEEERLAALHRTGLLDTPPEQAYDDLVRLAADLVGVPIAAIHLVAEDRQWGKAEIGLGTRTIPRDIAFCPAAMLEPEGMVVPDAAIDPRFADNPLVTGPSGIRFYAGMPLLAEGVPVGALCVIDTVARPDGLDARQRFALKALAAQASSQIALRRALAERDRADSLRRQTLDSATDFAIVSIDLGGRITGWNTGAENVLGWSEGEMLGQQADRFFTAEDREAGIPEAEMRLAVQNDRAADERWHQRKDGARFWASGEMLPLRDERGAHVGYLKMLRDRTEQHLAGEVLAAVNERFQLAQRATRDAIWDWNLADDSVLWNEALQDAYGWPPARVAPDGRWWMAHIHPEDRDRVAGSIRAVVDGGGTSWTDEYRFRRADGAYAEVLNRGSVIRDRDGRAVRMLGAMFDLTGRRQADRRRDALLELADRLRDLDDPSAMAAAAAGIVGRTLGVSRAGYGAVDAASETVMIERDWSDGPGMASLAGLHDFRAFGSFIEDMKRNDVVAVSDVACDPRTRPGSAEFAAIGVRSLLNVPLLDGGRLAAVVFAHTSCEHQWTEEEVTFARAVADRTWAALEQARSKAALRQVNETLEQQVARRTADRNRLWRMSTDLMLIAEFDGSILAINPAWTRILGWREEELLGTSLLSLIHPEDLGHTAEGAKAISEGTAYARFENRYRRADGGYAWITWTAGPDDGMIVAVGRDTTTEREQAEALQRSEEQLRQAQKMEAVGQLTGGLAHDFNNLLTGITGSLELLSTRMAQGRVKDLDRYVTAAEGAAKRAAALTHRLLAFSRRQTLDPKPTDANRLVAGMEELVRRTVGPAIQLEVVGAGGLWTTLVDPPQLENALLNLCINARDAMPEGGRITIQTANRWLDERAAQGRDLMPGQYVSLCVSDTGTGMSPDVIAKAFDPFFTTKPLGQGTGLGLSMIYGFARQSGGQARIYSELGRGTNVCLYLPRHVGDTDVAELAPELSGAPRAQQGETVLVVDDEPTVRMLVTEVLADLGYTAIEAADGPSGLKVLRSDTQIDLLVSDVGLPGGMNGRQMADAARVSRPHLKVLFITGYAENAVVGDGHLEPGMHVMTKPFAMEALASRIRELIATA